jgi:dihydropteroate synthase
VAERRKTTGRREGGKAERRKAHSVTRPPTLPPTRRVLFVTGKLAEPALRRVLTDMHPDFTAEVAVLRISVAALMTTPWIARFLEVPAGTDLVILPGLCEGDPAVIADKFGVRVEKGPKDLREIPRHFGGQPVAADYGAWDIEIVAEINNAGKLGWEALLAEAEYFRASGANLIDIGCTPGRAFPELGDVVRALVKRGMRVSVDSFDPDEIRRAVAAGAELVLSVNGSNRGVIKDLKGSNARVVAIPDFGAPLESLDGTLDALERARIRYLVDPVVEPIGFGFLASLERYAAARRRYPEAGLMMGVGNITELTAADSTGVNALLMGICQEVGVKAVLTTEVIPWARGSVRELDIARRLMHHAVTQKVVPKRLDDRLVTLKDPEILTYTDEELRALQARVTDPNFRIFADRDTITVFNSERYVRGTDPQEIFDQLGVSEASHAFYLGRELMKAKTAITLGKTYRQEGALNWGYLTPPDDARREHVRLTQRRERKAPRRRRA